MLLAADIGNTNIKFGVFDGAKLVAKVSLPTERELRSDGFVRLLEGKITQPIDGAIVCSVVPELNDAVVEFVASSYGVAAQVVTNDADFGLTINYTPLEDAGGDRLVNAFAAVEKYGAPCIICSFGTALAIDVVDAGHTLVGGLIAPGLNTLSKALKLATSRLPEVEIEIPDKAIQVTTVGSLQSGIGFGYLGLVESLISRVKNESGDNPKVIATGGSAQFIADRTALIDVVDRDLTLDGLRRLYQAT